MAESLSEAGKALSVSVGWNPLSGEFSINIVTGNVQVAQDLCKTAGNVARDVAQDVCKTAADVTRDVAREVCKTAGDVTRDVARDVCKTAGDVTRDVARDVCITAVSLGALYLGYESVRRLIESAVNRGLGGERDDQEVRDIRPGSLHVLLHCFTDERFLEVLADYESGRMKERLQEEFSQIGIKVEGLRVEIDNMVEVNETKDAINNRSHINKDLCEDVKNIVIDDVEGDLEKNKQVPGHFAERHFAERHFAERHFAEWIFCRRTFCRTDILPNGQFAERTTCRK